MILQKAYREKGRDGRGGHMDMELPGCTKDSLGNLGKSYIPFLPLPHVTLSSLLQGPEPQESEE